LFPHTIRRFSCFITKVVVPLHRQKDKKFRITLKLRKGKKMKKLMKKWMNSEAYREYCLNMARMYNYRAAN